MLCSREITTITCCQL